MSFHPNDVRMIPYRQKRIGLTEVYDGYRPHTLETQYRRHLMCLAGHAPVCGIPTLEIVPDSFHTVVDRQTAYINERDFHPEDGYGPVRLPAALRKMR